ncbi:MAG: hypothetical protein GC150_06325 [Rhizobiales bacterium]|nr:hypothetical protein [Hyphomicrobiales bacterium]
MSATRTSKALAALCAATSLFFAAPAVAQSLGDGLVFPNAEIAFRAGASAVDHREPDLAIPALEFAAGRGHLRAKYLLAHVLGTGVGPHVDHPRAFQFYSEIAALFSDIDVWSNDDRIPLVARALFRAALYMRDGIPSGRLESDPVTARFMFERGATVFGDPYAQFELAKMLLAGQGGQGDVQAGLSWLKQLSRDGFIEAQAHLADLLWRGEHTSANPVGALMLITIALDNAGSADTVWLSERHHQIFCSMAPEARAAASKRVLAWRERYRRRLPLSSRKDDDGFVVGHFVRFCDDGSRVAGPPAGSVPGSHVPSSSEGVVPARPLPPLMGLTSEGETNLEPASPQRSPLRGFIPSLDGYIGGGD